jgi:hypothetical protein
MMLLNSLFQFPFLIMVVTGFLISLKIKLLFENDSTNKTKMNHINTMLCGHFTGIDKLERLKLLQNDPLIKRLTLG